MCDDRSDESPLALNMDLFRLSLVVCKPVAAGVAVEGLYLPVEEERRR